MGSDDGDGNSREPVVRHSADRLSERCVAVLVNRFDKFPAHDQVPGRCVVGSKVSELDFAEYQAPDYSVEELIN